MLDQKVVQWLVGANDVIEIAEQVVEILGTQQP